MMDKEEKVIERKKRVKVIKGEKGKPLPCMYGFPYNCELGGCGGYNEIEIKLPIVDVNGNKITTHCLRLVVEATRLKALDIFSTNFIDLARGIAKAMNRNEN